ncbi:hypothetical protein L1987_39825 [Smallanthus sonchifolius]|uniref:Uncharacterized protein n=1 Tax=Smallanthus sonchifolius TaxID=185202 RepID=A0ACB9GRJ9_9ASTR|nr:hypothetical protein L1987_39825 [Smallanthus sonchifolius]
MKSHMYKLVLLFDLGLSSFIRVFLQALSTVLFIGFFLGDLATISGLTICAQSLVANGRHGRQTPPGHFSCFCGNLGGDGVVVAVVVLGRPESALL